MFFIDHNAKTTSFMDPRLPNDLPLLQSEAGAMPHLVIPSDQASNSTLLPPPPPRHHGASLTPPPSARAPSPATTPMSPNHLAPPPVTDGVNRRRSRSVGDEELNNCLSHRSRSSNPALEQPYPALAYNDRVVAFLRQPNIVQVLKEKDGSIGNHKSNIDKITAIRQEGTTALNRLSHDVELTLILR